MFNKKLSIITCSLFIIIIIAAFFRLHNITQTPPGLYPDEAMDGTNAQEAIATNNFKVFYPENNGREGLFMNIQAPFVMAFGNKPWALRLPSTLFGIFTVLGIYFLTKKLFENYNIEKFNGNLKPARDPSDQIIRAENHSGGLKIENSTLIALLSAFLLATNFWHINFSRISFRAIMAPFFLVWAIYFILKSFDDKNYKNSIIAGILYGLGFYSYIAFRATPLIIAVIFGYWIIKYPLLRKKIAKNFIVLTVVSLIIFAPLGYYFVKHPADFMGRTTQVSIFSSPSPLKYLAENTVRTLSMLNFSGDQNWRHNYSGNPELFWPVGIMFLVGIFFALISFFRNFNIEKFNENFKLKIENSFPFLVLFSWFITAMLPVVISNEGIPHALRSILIIPPVIILAGFGGIFAYKKLTEKFPNYKKILLLTSFFLLFYIILLAYISYFIKWAHNPNTAGAFAQNYVDMGNQLNLLPKEMPKYVIVEAGGGDVRGLPMPTQTIMFITDTFTPEKQKQKNLFYILPQNISQIPQNAYIIELK